MLWCSLFLISQLICPHELSLLSSFCKNLSHTIVWCSILFGLANYTCLPCHHEVSFNPQHGLFVWITCTACEYCTLVDGISYIWPCWFFQKNRLTFSFPFLLCPCAVFCWPLPACFNPLIFFKISVCVFCDCIQSESLGKFHVYIYLPPLLGGMPAQNPVVCWVCQLCMRVRVMTSIMVVHCTTRAKVFQ